MSADFGDIRSALHARDLHRLERFARRGLHSEHWAYVIQNLDHWDEGNRWCVGDDSPLGDALSLPDALIRYETRLKLSDKASPPALDVHRVLRVDQGPEQDGYRRTIATMALGPALVRWVDAIGDELWLHRPRRRDADEDVVIENILGKLRLMLRQRETIDAKDEPLHTLLGLRIGARLERYVVECFAQGAAP